MTFWRKIGIGDTPILNRGASASHVCSRRPRWRLVEGTEDYFVAVEGDADDRGILNVLCSCARFEDGVTCKHVWATLLAMDAEDESWRIGGTNELRFDVDMLFEMGLFDNPELGYVILASTERQPAEPPSPTWRSQLT